HKHYPKQYGPGGEKRFSTKKPNKDAFNKSTKFDRMNEAKSETSIDMDNKGRASVIKDKIEKLRKLSNSGEIDGDEFLDKFNPLSKELKSLDEGNSYARVSVPRFVKDKNNPNFLNVYIDYDLGPGGSSIALGKETMTGQIRRESAAEAMKLAGDVARDLKAKYNLEDIEISDLENGKVRVFAVSDDFIDMQVAPMNEATEKAWNALDVSRKAEKEIDNKEWNTRTTKKLDILKSLNKAGKFKKDWDEEKLQGWVDQNYSWEKLTRQFKLNEIYSAMYEQGTIKTVVNLKMDSEIGEPVTVEYKPGTNLTDVKISWGNESHTVDFEAGDVIDDHGNEGMDIETMADSDDGRWQFILDVQVEASFPMTGDFADWDFDELIVQSHPDNEDHLEPEDRSDYQNEDFELEPEDMDNPDEDLVIIGSGYLDIKNKFRERPSQTNGEYAEIGQKVVDQLHNGDKEAALDFIYSKINESNTNEYKSENKAQLDEGETENPNSIKVNAKVNNKETKVSIDQDNFPLNVTIKWDKDRDDMSNRPVRSKQDDELGSNSNYTKYWLKDHAEELDFESGDLLDDHGSEGKVMLFTATSRDKMWDFEVEVQVPYNYEDSGNINDIDWRTLEITSKTTDENTLNKMREVIKKEIKKLSEEGSLDDKLRGALGDEDFEKVINKPVPGFADVKPKERKSKFKKAGEQRGFDMRGLK
ncbi:MAG: hypothetical protein H8E16_05085, partial [Flavobacteriales bacterium]|nr:hypothetical protein [Flavobacteriales bacterium]